MIFFFSKGSPCYLYPMDLQNIKVRRMALQEAIRRTWLDLYHP